MSGSGRIRASVVIVGGGPVGLALAIRPGEDQVAVVNGRDQFGRQVGLDLDPAGLAVLGRGLDFEVQAREVKLLHRAADQDRGLGDVRRAKLGLLAPALTGRQARFPMTHIARYRDLGCSKALGQ
jgi:2-polyprenyl-6-methoxyphenol hydroxylase-like FAD-dependent oxidoreductase